MSGTPKILTLDIETAPATALVFGQYKQNIGNIQVVKPDRVIAFAAKWHGDKRVMFYSEYHDGRDAMIGAFNDLLNTADIVVHFNGGTFDMPWIRREIALAGLTPFSPVQEVDLLRVVRKQFRFMSNKLENIAKVFGVGLKMETGGFQLWRDIEVGSEEEQAKAWAKMRKYNKQDVVVTEALYDRLLPWIDGHPNVNVYVDDESGCPNCQQHNLRREGYAYTKLGKYPRFQCRDCGKWSRGKKSLVLADQR